MATPDQRTVLDAIAGVRIRTTIRDRRTLEDWIQQFDVAVELDQAHSNLRPSQRPPSDERKRELLNRIRDFFSL